MPTTLNNNNAALHNSKSSDHNETSVNALTGARDSHITHILFIRLIQSGKYNKLALVLLELGQDNRIGQYNRQHLKCIQAYI